jgi:hypothetical protein
MARIHLDAVRRARRDVEKARHRLLDAILAARDSGETQEDVGAAAGLTRQRVSQIEDERRLGDATASMDGSKPSAKSRRA